MSRLMDENDRDFVIALIDEAINNLENLKDAIENEDNIKLVQCMSTLANLRVAAKKWLEEN